VTVAAVAARHGVPATAVRPGARRRGERRKEATVIPVARKAGVRTPALVEYVDSHALVDSPYMVLERRPGGDLAALAGRPGGREALLELGRELARLRFFAGGPPEPWRSLV